LSQAHFKEKTIISLICSSPTAFDLSATTLIGLKQRGVSERVMMEMVKRQPGLSAPEGRETTRDPWFFTKEDEAFFNSMPSFQEALGDRPAKPGKTSIFGSASDSQSATRTRQPSADHSQQGESELAGTATVSIIRAPAQEGVLKLERAPKLDNQVIIKLIEACFSEGTILRKIETTQIDFDTSPKALAELRRNRVSERIIRAMTEAMGEDQK
jgi:hypothetical protein